MRAIHSVQYFTTLISSNGKIFDYNKIMESNCLTDTEKRSMILLNNATVIKYKTTRADNELTNEDYLKLFGDCMIDEKTISPCSNSYCFDFVPWKNFRL